MDQVEFAEEIKSHPQPSLTHSIHEPVSPKSIKARGRIVPRVRAPKIHLPGVSPDSGMEKIKGAMQARAHRNWTVQSPDPVAMEKQMKVWNILLDYYFRVEIDGWEHLPGEASLLTGIHSGTWLTMDAWTLCAQWWRRFGTKRSLHGTAHDALMAMPVIGEYFRKVGVIPATRKSVTEALAAGHDVALWPGGEVDAMRSWSKRDKVVLGGRKGFIRQAMRSNVPIVPVPTVGGHDTVFVLSEGRRLAKLLRLKKILRSDICPVVLGAPFGLTLEALPMHIPLPAKIRTRVMEPLYVDPAQENNQAYVDEVYEEVEHRLQKGVDDLAVKRKFFLFG